MVIEIKGNIAPAIIKARSKTYVVSGNRPWIEVPDDTTLDDIKWIDPYINWVGNSNKKPTIK